MRDNPAMDGIVIPPDAERVPRGTGTFRVLAELDELEVIDMRFGPEFEGVDPHTHDDHVDSFYVLEGEAEFMLGDEVVRASPGTFVAAPPGLVHGFRSVGDVDLRILNVHAPNTGFARRFRER
jgi:mannose-6-phosphate isomerase-like protein (cupin superfamily)